MGFFSGKAVKTTKKPNRWGLIIFVILLFTAIGVGAWYASTKYDLSNINLYSCYWDSETAAKKIDGSGTKSIFIAPGLTALQIGMQLKEAGLIDNAEYFACYVKKTGTESTIQAGYFEIPQPVSIESIVPLLSNAQVPAVKVVIPEGLRADEIADTIDKALSDSNPIKKFDKAEFMALTTNKEYIATFDFLAGITNLEGFLFPDTYFVAKDTTTTDIMDTLVKTFQDKVQPADMPTTRKLRDNIIIASLIEKEATGNYEEKQMISDIIQRRLDQGWFLDIDATFLYEKKNWKHQITIQDKRANTPYNSYLRKGLPPTPICNPGLASVQAALNPKSNQFWYYLHGTDGVVRYGKTYEEHLMNIDRYLR